MEENGQKEGSQNLLKIKTIRALIINQILLKPIFRILYILPLLYNNPYCRRGNLTQTHYQTLGVSRKATSQEIKKAFRGLAIRYHPDVTQLDKDLAMERFKDISEAYWILKDSQRRKEYDVSLPDPKKEVKTYDGPPPWAKMKEEDWIWDDRNLRYRRKQKDERGVYEARSPFSSKSPGIVFYKKTPWDRFVEGVQKATQPYRFWFGKRWRILRLRYALFLDWLLKRRYHAKKPHKIRNPRLD